MFYARPVLPLPLPHLHRRAVADGVRSARPARRLARHDLSLTAVARITSAAALTAYQGEVLRSSRSHPVLAACAAHPAADDTTRSALPLRDVPAHLRPSVPATATAALRALGATTLPLGATVAVLRAVPEHVCSDMVTAVAVLASRGDDTTALAQLAEGVSLIGGYDHRALRAGAELLRLVTDTPSARFADLGNLLAVATLPA